jgi:predicted outer membrane repeat protein
MVLFTVTTANDENDGGTGGSGLSLREALALANSTAGVDSITFDAQLLSGKTISLTLGELIITDSLTLTGLGANNLSVSGNNLSRVFRVDNGNSSSALAVSLSGITLTGGNSSADGGGIFNQENLSLSDTIVTGNSAAGNGGGLFNGIGTVTLSNSTFTNNRASQDGGGLFNEGSLSASNSSFSNNTAGNSGGGVANNGGTTTLSGSSFTNNSAVNHGGGLLTVAGGTSTIEQSSFSGNSAGGNGGGISSNLSTTSLSNSNLSGNRATNNGGGIYSNLSTISVNNSNLSGNSATNNGGGIYSDLSTTNVSNSNLSTNSALNNGGGIASTNSSSTTLNSSSLTQNAAGNNGGGFSNSDGSFARLNNNTLNGNTATNNGGGLANESGGTAILSQNTFSHNMAANSGGGIYAENSDTRLSNSTVTLNGAASGGGLFNDLGSTTVTSTIVAGNTNNQDLGGSAFSSGGNNLVGNGSGASGFTNGVNGDLVGTAANPIDPLLGALQNNGGPTLTHALLAGSRAINAGSNPDNLQNDQRGSGFPRTLDGATDIGAIEQKLVPVPGIRLEQAVNAADPNNPTAEEDADLPPGRALPVGTNVTWTYQVFNEGNVPLTVTSITDDFGTPNNPADDFTSAPVLSNGFNVGDSNKNNRLDTTEVWRYTSAGVVSYQVQGSTGGGGIGGINLGKLTDYLFFFANGSAKANWQGATKGFVGDVAVNGISAAEKTSGDVPYAGTIYTNDASLGAWQKIVDQNSGKGKFSKNQASVSQGENARISSLQTDLTNAFAQINALSATAGYTSRSSTSLNGLNTTNGLAETFVINITSGLNFSSKINITGDAGDVFVLRWDADGNPLNGYQGQVKPQSGGAIVPLGGLKPSNFINVAGDLNASGGGSNPPSPYPQGPRHDNGTGALIDGGKNFSGGGFFTGYWLTTGTPDSGKTAPFSNAIFVGGWYTTTTEFSMTSGTSGVRVAPPPQSNGGVTFYTNIAKVTAQEPNTGVVVTDTDSSSFFGINGQSLQGTSQNNTLVGTSNNDYIVGGAGQDILTGNGGNDIFGYQALSDAGDTITDFASGDLISILPLLNSVGYTGSDPLADGYLKVYQQGNNTVISFDADGNSGAASPVTLVTLENFQGSLSYDSTRGLLGGVLPDAMPAI